MALQAVSEIMTLIVHLSLRLGHTWMGAQPPEEPLKFMSFQINECYAALTLNMSMVGPRVISW